MRSMSPFIILACAAGLLGGCQEASVADIKGACDAFERPEQPVLGKRKIDQRWIRSRRRDRRHRLRLAPSERPRRIVARATR